MLSHLSNRSALRSTSFYQSEAVLQQKNEKELDKEGH